MVKLGVSAWFFPKEIHFEEILRKIKKAEFDGFEATLSLSDVKAPDVLAEKFAEMGRKADELGLEIHSVATGLF